MLAATSSTFMPIAAAFEPLMLSRLACSTAALSPKPRAAGIRLTTTCVFFGIDSLSSV